MKKQVYQVPELRDASNNIIQAGTYGRTSPLVNADNTGILDYVNNNLEALHDAQTSGTGVRAAEDTKGNAIDIAALKTLITDTVTQAKKDAILAAHPVGSYYISDKATDPGTLFGGTWKMLDPGLTLISQGKGTDKFGSFEFVAGQTYGERMHQLTVDELAVVKLELCFQTQNDDNKTEPQREVIKTNKTHDMYGVRHLSQVIAPFGGDKPHNNMQPSKAVFAWLRTA
ncbi:hypothetical protein ACE418_01930 [Megasphaera sp. WILCCON 0056]|uniref:phage baseplate protein n=1 Tax=Megasphaera sp. WILCCON 0056 TaxID=3345340 RepID=UPI003A80DC32